MKYLQALVPGCDKFTNKAGMLDEIINYVLSLQTQVEFLSIKLAALSSSSDPPLQCFNNGQAPSMWEPDVQNLYSTLGV
ncbi:hypothetical protein F2Q69_00009579 [Brassica cretica]|uniref:BHLH domain-containing protein n=1 Tax=Brassica cretica TaxID=69181 RepID=A0A8S9NZK8_BRACR|nr:hypothetical protein F2Q69_00009579 [Brassica cretica]